MRVAPVPFSATRGGPGERGRSRAAPPRPPRAWGRATVSSGQPATNGGFRTPDQPGAWAVAPPDRGASHRGKHLSRAGLSGLTSLEDPDHIVCVEHDRSPPGGHHPGVQDSTKGVGHAVATAAITARAGPGRAARRPTHRVRAGPRHPGRRWRTPARRRRPRRAGSRLRSPAGAGPGRFATPT